MTEDKTLIKKDIIKIVKINEKMHYNNPEEVKKIHNALMQQRMFSTSMGKRYVKKLEQILSGNDDFKCLFCGSEIMEKTVICSGCLSKIQPMQKTQLMQGKSLDSKENKVQKVKIIEKNKILERVKSIKNKEKNKDKYKLLKELIQKLIKITVEKGIEIKDKIKDAWKSPKVQELKDKSLYKIEGLFYSIKEFWYSLSGMKKIIVIGIFVLVAAVIIGICTNKPGASGSQSGKNVSSADEAVEVLEIIFPEEEYILKYQQLLYPAKAMFEGEVGEYCGKSWSDKLTIDAYVISVQSIEKPRYSCICYVSKDGRIIGYGSLIYEADTSAYFRLK